MPIKTYEANTTTTSDGSQTFTIDFIPPSLDVMFSVTCYSDTSYTTTTSASAGTLTITASEDGQNYGTIESGTVDLTDGDYDRPYMYGYAQYLKLTLADVSGVSAIKVRAIYTY